MDEPISPLRLRLATLLFPPLGLLLLWRSSARISRKLLGTIGISLFALLYCALFIFILVRLGALKIEWRGGYAPSLTWRRNLPDFDARTMNRVIDPAANHFVAGSAPWPGFRGPNRDSHYDANPILTNWPAQGLKLLWHQPSGGGYSSFAIAGGFAFTIEQRHDSEVAVAYDFSTGTEMWKSSWSDHFQEFFSEEGPRSTPAYSDGKIYVLGAMGELRCLDAETGKTIWSHNILVENHAPVPTYGIASSPLILGDKLIVQGSPGRAATGNGKSVLCYDKRDGKLLWSALNDVMGYASPALVNLAGQDQIIVCAETRTMGLSIDDGSLLWEIPWRVLHNQLPIAQPVILSTNRFLLSAGYFTGCAAVEVTRSEKIGHEASERQRTAPEVSDGHGSVVPLSPSDGERAGVRGSFSARVLWQNKYLKNKFTSSVYWQGYIYGLDEDILTCLDATTGERKWKDGRYGYGQLLLASGHLVILSGEGDLALVKASPHRYDELARFPAIKGKTWNHPAIADGKILIRNAEEMACFQIAP